MANTAVREYAGKHYALLIRSFLEVLFIDLSWGMDYHGAGLEKDYRVGFPGLALFILREYFKSL